jgi:ribonuclease HII
MILGIDEVGRGAWAGPLVVGAVVLGGVTIEGLADSKLLTEKQRGKLNEDIISCALSYGLGWVHADELDKIGLSEALKVATRRAVEQIKISYSEIIIDGTVNFLKGTNKEQFVTTIKKADQLIPSVSAASIIAKVARDKYMKSMKDEYPGYSFERNVGYGTKLHSEGIVKNGITEIHRKTFKPIKDNTKLTGDKAERLVVEFLKSKGHEILDRNWNTRFCEVDVISRLNNRIYFTEVKYRYHNNYGSGLDAITPAKVKKMTKGAISYMLKFPGIDYILAVASVSSMPMIVDEWLEIV